jgi:hypothetical protein
VDSEDEPHLVGYVEELDDSGYARAEKRLLLSVSLAFAVCRSGHEKSLSIRAPYTFRWPMTVALPQAMEPLTALHDLSYVVASFRSVAMND